MSLYYKEELDAHEHRPAVAPNFKYLDNERQWLLVEHEGSRIGFLRYYIRLGVFHTHNSLVAIWHVLPRGPMIMLVGIMTFTV